MGKQLIQTHQFPNGLTLVMESMQNVQSTAFSILVPGGSIYDQSNRHGTASILSDLITRGAGPYDSKQLSCALDNLGVQRHEGASSAHITFSGATLADNLEETLKIYSEILKAPHLPEDQFDASRAGAEQALLSTEDDPRQKALVELKRRSFPAPWGLPSDGDLASLPNISVQDVKQHYETCFHPNEMIIGVAGKIDFDEVLNWSKRFLAPGNRAPVSKIRNWSTVLKNSISPNRKPHRPISELPTMRSLMDTTTITRPGQPLGF